MPSPTARRRLPSHLALLLLVALVAGTATVVADDPPPTAPLPSWKAGEHEGMVKIDGKDERFVALVPKGYSPRKPVAVVLLLHGNGGKAADFLRQVKTFTKKPPLLISLERCDNNQDAVGYAPKYLDQLRLLFAIDEEKVFAVGFSGGGFRLWDDVVCQADQVARFRGVVLAGSARQSFDPPDKPQKAATVVLVGDRRDSNFKDSAPAAEKALREKGYEVIVLEHTSGHSLPPSEMKEVFAWIEALAAGKKATLATRRAGGNGAG
jgi:predicted esterase